MKLEEITSAKLSEIAGYMSDEIREQLHSKLSPCSPADFLREYVKHDPDIIPILRDEFEIEI